MSLLGGDRIVVHPGGLGGRSREEATSIATDTLLRAQAALDAEGECYVCDVDVKGGGKWKRIILRAADFKGEKGGRPLSNFCLGNALVFNCAGEEQEFAITNILWL